MKCEHITYNCQVKGNISMSQTSQPLQGNSLTTALGRDTKYKTTKIFYYCGERSRSSGLSNCIYIVNTKYWTLNSQC